MERFPIFLVTSTDNVRLAMSFLRFQEFYESPQFKGKIFTLAEYKKWYKKEHGGKFSYCTDWTAFNIPAAVLIPFRAGKFRPLSEEELTFLNLMSDVNDPAYIIGVNPDDRIAVVDMRHELVHALMHIDKKRSDILIEFFLSLRSHTRLFKIITEMGYHGNVIIDEAIAYLLTGFSEEFDKLGAESRVYDVVRDKLRLKFAILWGFAVEALRRDQILGMIHERNLDDGR